MITRRTFVGSLVLAASTSRIDARWTDTKYRVGIADSLVTSPGDEPINESMTKTFEFPGKPKCLFEFGPPSTIAKRLQDEHTNLCVMNGVEYAWIKCAHPELVPLVTAFTTDVKMKGCVVVNAESKVNSLLDLRDKTIYLPERLPHHTYVYLHHAIVKKEGNPKSFFKQAITTANADEGIEGIIDGQADAILLDFDSWKGFLERKPGRSKKLRVLDQSCDFPTPVILYQKNCWSKVELLMLEVALCMAHEKPYSRQLFNFWGISRFVPCGARYRRAVEGVLHEMPDTITPVDFVTSK